ncbi:hypothetical protein ACVNIS_03575 [Sphaerotilaceae bacterium SBD11-9]
MPDVALVGEPVREEVAHGGLERAFGHLDHVEVPGRDGVHRDLLRHQAHAVAARLPAEGAQRFGDEQHHRQRYRPMVSAPVKAPAQLRDLLQHMRELAAGQPAHLPYPLHAGHRHAQGGALHRAAAQGKDGGADRREQGDVNKAT